MNASIAIPIPHIATPIDSKVTVALGRLTATTNLSYFKTACLNLRLFIPL